MIAFFSQSLVFNLYYVCYSISKSSLWGFLKKYQNSMEVKIGLKYTNILIF